MTEPHDDTPSAPPTGVAPPRHPTAPIAPEEKSDATGGVIPYKNPPALIAYYLGLFSLFPVVGFVLAVPAFILGIIGMRNYRRNPTVRGPVHAGIGIGCGLIFMLVWGAAIVMIAIRMLAG